MFASLRSVRFPVETGLLLGLAFFLPLAEAPKNLLWLAYAATWLANRARAGDWGGRWDGWDTLIALWIASGFLVAAFAGLHKSEWQGAGDLLRYASLLWLVKRGGYAGRELKWLLGALVASTVIGLAIGYFRLWTGLAKSGHLQLHSVGHVNHTAIYLAINAGTEADRGWGIPMATDIAFVVGCLALFGKRIPDSLRVFALALAIIDDIGAILVIGVVYSHGFHLVPFLLASAGLGLTALMQWLGVRPVSAYWAVGFLTWVALHESGIHPTIAGVALGLLTPTQAWVDETRFDHFLAWARKAMGPAEQNAGHESEAVRRAVRAAVDDVWGKRPIVKVLVTRPQR